MTDDSVTPVESALRRATQRVEELAISSAWTDEDDDRLDLLFESAAVRALRVPAIAERSRHLRRIGKLVIPRFFRPMLRRGLSKFDHLARRLMSDGRS